MPNDIGKFTPDAAAIFMAFLEACLQKLLP